MRMPSVTAVLALCAAAVCAGPAAAAGGRAELAAQMAASLKSAGPQATIERYFDCQHGPGYAVVASGDARAVALAAELRSSSDACVSEKLADALARALARRPLVVLPLVDKTSDLAARQICAPFIPAETSKAEALRLLARSARAVGAVRDPKLARQKAACLKIIGDYQAAEKAR